MSRLLLLEDDVSLGETLKERLQREGHSVTWVESCQMARERINLEQFDLLILDVSLPDGNGFELAREVRARHFPFLFMTALNTAENRLEGYELGAEEFIPKPFHLKELLLRVSHVLKVHGHVNEKMDFGSVVVDFSRFKAVRADGTEETLAKRDLLLLKLLIDRAQKVVSRDEILNQIWGEDRFPSHRTVDNSIVRLRQILGAQGDAMIGSVRGIGYQWMGPQK